MQLVKRLVLLLMAAGLAACATGGAQVIEERPTLAVPPVPPRTIEAQPQVEPPVAEPIVEPVAPLPPAPKPRPNRPPATSEPKPDPKPEQPVETVNATVPNPPPVAALRTPSTPSGPEATRQIKETLARAEGILSRVDYQRLSADKRANYDNAKAWMLQADEAIKKDDLRLAANLAERAENIAKLLEPR